MKSFSNEERAAIACGWAESGRAQNEYAEQFGIADRTLRLWLARYASNRPPLDEARAVLVHAIERLQALLAAVDSSEVCQPERGAASPPADSACQPAAALADVQPEAGVVCTPRPSAPPKTAAAAARHADFDALLAGVQSELMRPPTTGAPAALRSEKPRAVGGAKSRVRAGGFFANWTRDDEAAGANSRLPPVRPPE